ncbi:MAG: SPOR domain-containing protein [Gammaproteobacteria bacterium]|nr:SPOR domain-containing protein [Gammaproteobacteria bacterium]
MGALMICCAGCATSSSQSDRESWFCARTPDGRDWACSQSKRNGTPAAQGAAARQANPADASRQVARGGAVGTATVAGDSKSATGNTAETAAQSAFVHDSAGTGKGVGATNRWSAGLPALSAGGVDIPPVPASEAPNPEPRKPPPEPEPVLARWEKAAADVKAVAERKGDVRELAPESEKALAVPAPKQSAPSVGQVSGSDQPGVSDRRTYTVQIGAFKSERAARAYIAQHNLGELPNLILRHEPQGSRLALVTFGDFDSVKAALEAWRRSGAPRDLDIWVRPVHAVSPASPETAPVASPARL